ncbi:Staphylococcal nuclease domain-containing protein 1, partial [Schistosoma japonicum]
INHHQLLVTAQEQAKSLGKGRWSPNSAITREIVWSFEDTCNFFEKYKNQPLKAVVESVRDGCSVQVFILPESLREKPNTFHFVGSILHPNGNIAELLLRQGLACCIDWNLNLVSVPGAAKAYKAAERFAKEKRSRLFENYQPTQAMEVHVDTREVLRLFIGKHVTAQVDYIQPKTSNTADERVCATVRADDVNLALLLVSKGLGSVIRYRNSSDPRTVYYNELLATEEDAQSKGFGMYCKQDPPIHRVTDLTGNVAKSRQFLSFLQRAERLDGVVEFVFSASRYRIYIPQDTCIITLLLAGIQCPRRGRICPDGVALPDMPFSNEAYTFTKELCMQRNVEVRVETIDRVGNFVGGLQ